MTPHLATLTSPPADESGRIAECPARHQGYRGGRGTTVAPIRNDHTVATFNDYDTYASAYDAGIENNVYNALHERPATLALVGDVGGRKVLDAGCGSGALSRALAAAGAAVTGVDLSTGLLAIARTRLGPTCR